MKRFCCLAFLAGCMFSALLIALIQGDEGITPAVYITYGSYGAMVLFALLNAAYEHGKRHANPPIPKGEDQ